MSSVVFPFDPESFFDRCVKQKDFPKNDFKKQAVLLRILKDFEDKRVYLEQEVNEKIGKYFDDFATIRRELVNFGYMQRNPTTSEYWVKKRTFTMEDIQNNTLLRRHAQQFLQKTPNPN